MFDILSGPLAPPLLAGLAAASFAGSFMTAALGLGGGLFLLAVMAAILPPAALIPVHGVVQLGSNLGRATVLRAHVFWAPVPAFAGGAVIGVLLGGLVAVSIPPELGRLGIGLFVLWSTLATPPRWLKGMPALTGAVTSGLTMLFGATGPFVASYVRALALPRHGYVATHATLMVLQHVLKTLAFGTLGFAFAPWIGPIALLIGCGLLGTLAGKQVLDRVTDHGFDRVLKWLLVGLALWLIWQGVSGLASSRQ
ncbi:TSUP family transporter [Mesobacterium pallidum]|uniref:TSUP family transporter n=1 Tax=Mesobacterium pallidum TaxID=2872037 RepID=UPI001EE1E36E|nr:TSUP family transporter [Mesobacterium pallidum]